MHPSHVVVDTRDGLTLTSVPDVIDTSGHMTGRNAQSFANLLNSDRKPQYRTWRVFRLTPVEGGRRRSK